MYEHGRIAYMHYYYLLLVLLAFLMSDRKFIVGGPDSRFFAQVWKSPQTMVDDSSTRKKGDVAADHNDDTAPSASYKHHVRGNDSLKRVSHVQFCLMSAEDMRRTAEFQVVSSELYTIPSRAPAKSGCLDPRLGVNDKTSVCATCQCKLEHCAGHFGYIKLALPVFHIGFFKHTLNFLQCICKTCSRVLLTDYEKEKIIRRMRHPNTDSLAKASIFKSVIAKCKKNKRCPGCTAVNGTVKKLTGQATLKLIHERYKKDEEEYEDFKTRIDSAAAANPEIATLSSSMTGEDLLPTVVLDLFKKISDRDCELLWMESLVGRPEDVLLQYLLVPPVPMRPSAQRQGGSNEDDLTVKLQEILDVNIALQLSLAKGPHTRTIMEQWDLLTTHCAQYMNGETPGIQRPIGSKPMRGLCQRLKGKQGRFRQNLSGKRVDFSARTVISPDPNLRVDQVGVPRKVAMIMTYPEVVNEVNMEKLRQLVRNGPEHHPGANMIRLKDGSFTKWLAYCNLETAATSLRIGDVVERHMEDDDVVLFNRQPSLHKISIMAHRAKILEWQTFRFNICCCAPYNADFDGDEMNLHLPQTEEARTEASLLMGVEQNLVTPRNGEPLVAASQDFLSASYLLTQKSQFFTFEQFCQLAGYFGDAVEHIDVPWPALLKPVPLWTGKQVFTVLLYPNHRDKVPVSFEHKEKNYGEKKSFCPNDGWVAFRGGELVSGNIAKKTIGNGSKTGLIYVLLRDHGCKAAATCLNRWARFCGRYMGGHRGLSIGISDVTPSERLSKMKYDILHEGYVKADANIALYDKGELELRPGCDSLQSLEEILNGILGRLRESAGQEAMKALPWTNSPRIMADCGSKGSPLNISQMISCVGQQAVGGQRIQNGFAFRTLPHFEYHSLTPSAKGFVANSFYSGLTGSEFFFHMMGGREGLVDTAVKTAQTGYMGRRLMKALEDLSLQYDNSVRNSEQTIVQLSYGDDGLNPDRMENNGRPIDYARLHMNIRESFPCSVSEALSEFEAQKCLEEFIEAASNEGKLPTGNVFLQEMRDWLSETYNNKTGNPLLTAVHLQNILAVAADRFTRAHVEPGEALGATAAQSISEPATQMTLKTFHFSGISSMNVTLGVPRVQEIINAAKVISTPIITAKLQQDKNKVAARIVKAVIEKTSLGEVSKYIKEVYAPDRCYVSIELDLDAIEQLKLNIDASAVRDAILKPGSRNIVMRALSSENVQLSKKNKAKLRVQVPHVRGSGKNRTTAYFSMQMLKTALPDVIVQGIKTVNRAVINEQDKDGQQSYELLMEGYGLLDVMGSPGIDGLHTTTNHVFEVETVLGIEAARTKIVAEILHIMNAYGIGIDIRHLLLLADVMTFRGEVLGITRFGVAKMRESVFMLASFEKTTDHLFDAAVHGRMDELVGVTECIIIGKNMPIGTGLPTLLWQPNT